MNKKKLVMAFIVCSVCFICTNITFAMVPEGEHLADDTNPFTVDGFVSIAEEGTFNTGAVETQNSSESQGTYSNDEVEGIAQETDPFHNNGFHH